MTLVMDGSFLGQTGRVRQGRVSAGVFEEAVTTQPRTGFVLQVAEGDAPFWLTEVVRRLNVAVAATSDEVGWQPMTSTAVVSSLQALRRVMSVDSGRPSVTPLPEGGLQFEWHEAGWDIEIEVDPVGSIDTWGQHLDNGSTFDGPLADTAEVLRVALKDITLHHRTESD